MTSGSLVAVDSQVRARNIAGGCGAGSAIATAMGRWKASTDTAALAEIFSAGVADADVANAAVSLATDGNASTIARVLSIRLLLARLYGAAPSGFRTLTVTVSGDICLSVPSGHGDVDPRPLSPSIATAARAAIGPLEGNGAVAASIRSASNCLMNAWRRASGYPVMPVGSYTSALTVQYVCRSRFQIRNTADVPLEIQYKVGSGSAVSLPVMARVAPATEALTAFDVGSPTATVSILVDGAVIGSVSGTNTICPP